MFSFREKYIDPDYVMTYVCQGTNHLIMHENIYDITPGCLVVIPPKTLHWYTSTPKVFYTLTFDLFFSALSLVDRYERTTAAIDINPQEGCLVDYAGVVQLTAEKREWFEARFLELVALNNVPGDNNRLRMKAIVIEMIDLYLKETHRSETQRIPGIFWRKIEKAVQYIHEHYADPTLGNREIARQTGFTENYLVTLFTRYIGLSTHRYINNLRVKQACMLIREDCRSFAEISESVGFSTQQTFSKVFRRETGITPSEYQQRCRNTQ